MWNKTIQRHLNSQNLCQISLYKNFLSKDVFRLQELYKKYYLFLEETYFQIPLFEKPVWTDSFFLKKNFMNPFYGWGSAAWRLGSLRGCSLLFTNKFPEIPGTYFIGLWFTYLLHNDRSDLFTKAMYQGFGGTGRISH